MLSDLRSANPSNLNLDLKFTDFQEIINGNVDVASIAETTIDVFFLLFSLFLKDITGDMF